MTQHGSTNSTRVHYNLTPRVHTHTHTHTHRIPTPGIAAPPAPKVPAPAPPPPSSWVPCCRRCEPAAKKPLLGVTAATAKNGTTAAFACPATRRPYRLLRHDFRHRAVLGVLSFGKFCVRGVIVFAASLFAVLLSAAFRGVVANPPIRRLWNRSASWCSKIIPG